ncbi:iron(III) transport system ATP-binding protein [Alkalithermobacter thermoalcaliphilus JW-YL-7 = DSM 7308]|uniref:ABC-type quaternary amine transporter n=1 Tax=Alkalithermobacter thermoalcaliphilus JW-YL-7 = DSM 7308 TaxID=1121328 RepID=A0A150FRZ4_CLOPD|nr:Fe(3+)-transporting ATPase [[Clostridium] paradoxum JW-YL-7 = DSM 7308]SHK34971.1 iron(III) transport system ATP-binding protein [[Clostridium] paradoxum JW-YL-7 = DSM 7308]
MSSIELKNISKRYKGEKRYALSNVDLQIKDGEIVTLLGPSGCGKTTTLRLIAGFEKPESGTIRFGNEYIVDDNTFIPPQKRGVGMVFQDYALFPHLTVYENISFGMKKDKDLSSKMQSVLHLVKLSGLEKRYPSELSGGQQQRVALARALIRSPKVILFDEPFSNLDTDLRTTMRGEIVSIIKKTKSTAIFVTHDQKEAMAISDRVIVMNNGFVEQIGTPKEIFEKPKNKFVAEFIGFSNIFKGKINNNILSCDFTDINIENKENMSGQVYFSIKPSGIRINDEGNLSGVVRSTSYFGDYLEVFISYITKDKEILDLVCYEDPSKDLKVGDSVRFSIDKDKIVIWKE